MTSDPIGLRQRKRTMTRDRIQQAAMELFTERGFSATTIAEVAATAEVSAMTVFRYFPTKEDLVLADPYDPVIVERIAGRPSGESPARRIAGGLLAAMAELTSHERALLLARLRLTFDTPALRARRWDHQYATQRAIVEAIRTAPSDQPIDPLRLWATAGACMAAASAGLMTWVDQSGQGDPADLVATALTVVADVGEPAPTAKGRP